MAVAVGHSALARVALVIKTATDWVPLPDRDGLDVEGTSATFH